MLICHCSLAGTAACYSCPRYLEQYVGYATPLPYWPISFPPYVQPGEGTSDIPNTQDKKVKRTTKTYEYDGKGRVTKEIIEESE